MDSRKFVIGNYMGHIAFIMLLANPELLITCIDDEDNRKYINLLEKYFEININFIPSNNQENIINILSNINNSFDLIHISQQYPVREYLNNYIDICIEISKKDNLTFIIDDYNVYSNEIIDKIKIVDTFC